MPVDWWWVTVTQPCLTLCDPLDCSPPGSSVHGILQARILGWVAIPVSRGTSWPKNQTQVPFIAGGFFTIWASRDAVDWLCPSINASLAMNDQLWKLEARSQLWNSTHLTWTLMEQKRLRSFHCFWRTEWTCLNRCDTEELSVTDTNTVLLAGV